MSAQPMTAPPRLVPRADWEWDAECQTLPAAWFVGKDERALTITGAREGRAICGKCPVRRDCLLDALRQGEKSGLRGGFLGHERRRVLKRNGGSIAAAMDEFDAGTFGEARRGR